MINPLCVPKGFIIFCIAFLGCFYLSAQPIAQSTPINFSSSLTNNSPEAQPLTIGDKMPDILFENVLNYKSNKAKLSDFKGKLVILDFWATWCSSCIKNFPKMDSLYNQLGNQVQIVLVNTKSTGDSKEKIEDFLNKWKIKHPTFQIPIAILDTIANTYFSHLLIPHYAWIDADRIVRAITSSEQVTKQNIQSLLADGSKSLPIKKDIDLDKPLFAGDYLHIDDFTYYSLFLKGKIDGLPSGNRLRKNNEITRGVTITNTPIFSMYKIVISSLFPDINFTKRIILETADSSKLIFDKDKSFKPDWYKENLYNYDFIVPISKANDLYEYMLEDLNRYSNYFGRIENRRMNCLILVRSSHFDKIKTEGGKQENKLLNHDKKFMINSPLVDLVRRINNFSDLKLTVIDETNYLNNIDIELDVDFDDLSALRAGLLKYDLNLIEGERIIQVFVLGDTNVRERK